MVRPPKKRMIGQAPNFKVFKPAGIPVQQSTAIVLSVDEFEAIRLVDHEGLDHEGAASLMGVSRPTLSRIVDRARSKVAECLVKGQVLMIEGGNVVMEERSRCGSCGQEVPRRGPDRRRVPCCEPGEPLKG